MEKEGANRGKFTALLKTLASVVPFLFEDGCSFADFKETIAKRQNQGRQHPHNDKFTLFYEQSGVDVTLDSNWWIFSRSLRFACFNGNCFKSGC